MIPRAHLFLFCLLTVGPAFAEEPMPLGAASHKPRAFVLHPPQSGMALQPAGPGRFLALPAHGPATAIRITRGRRFPLPARAEDPAASAPARAKPSPPAAPRENDAAMGATVAAQGAVSRQGAQLADPIDLLLSTKPAKR